MASTQGTEVAEPMEDSVQIIVDDNQSFDDELMAEGIVDVRIRRDIDTPRGIEAGDDPDRSPATTAIVSVAAAGAIVLAAVAFRRSTRKEVPVGNEDEAAPDAESNTETVQASAAG